MPELAGVRLAHCSVSANLNLSTRFERAPKQRIRIETEIPDGLEGYVEVRCEYEREESEDAIGWKIAFVVGFNDVEVGTHETDLASEAIGVAHPYVRALLINLGGLMDNASLKLPAQVPTFVEPEVRTADALETLAP